MHNSAEMLNFCAMFALGIQGRRLAFGVGDFYTRLLLSKLDLSPRCPVGNFSIKILPVLSSKSRPWSKQGGEILGEKHPAFQMLARRIVAR